MDLETTTDQTTIPSVATRYQRVNGAWPEGKLPPLTMPEARAAVRLLCKAFGEGRHFNLADTYKATSGNRYNKLYGTTYKINLGRGWRSLVHSVSHKVWRRLFPAANDHAPGHAYLERQMIEHAITSGWLDGKLRRAKQPAKPKPDIKVVRLARLQARLKKWTAKHRRAETMVQKLKHQIGDYQRRGITCDSAGPTSP